jgi:hypothetical protein
VGVIIIEAEVAPVLQENVVPPDAVNVMLFPGQTEVFPPMFAVMLADTVTVATAAAVQFPVVTHTVYEVVAVGETVMEEVFAPVFQR